jgi:hypothetical protein
MPKIMWDALVLFDYELSSANLATAGPCAGTVANVICDALEEIIAIEHGGATIARMWALSDGEFHKSVMHVLDGATARMAMGAKALK